MVSFGEKTKIKKAGNLNSGRSYVFTTVNISNYSKTMTVQTVSTLATQKATKVVGLCKTFPRVRAFANRQSNDTAIKIMIMAINKLFSLNLIIIQGISFFFVLIKTHYTLLQ